jgi:RNA polymerase sigma-70 factor (ECF subfamily)
MSLSNPTTYSEIGEATIMAAQRGDKSALGAIYDAYAHRLYRYLHSRVHNAMDAEDLLTQTFMRVLETLPAYRHRGQFTAWIFQIARNKVIDHFRRHRDVAELKDDVHDSSPVNDFLENVIQRQNTEHLDRLLKTLDEDELELVRLRFAANLSYVEMAVLLGRKEDAVRKSLQRTLNRMYAQMEAQYA